MVGKLTWGLDSGGPNNIDLVCRTKCRAESEKNVERTLGSSVEDLCQIGGGGGKATLDTSVEFFR